MPADALHLLKRLDPPVKPGAAPSTSARANDAVQSADFQQILSLASDGRVRSGREVDFDAEVDESLDASQLDRLSAAADLAEAAGAARAVMLIDGRALLMDVPERRITEELHPAGESRIANVDAAVSVGDPEHAEPPPPLVPGTGLPWPRPAE